MPLFEYQCLNYERVLELFVQRVDPTAVYACPTCGKANVQRLLSSFAAKSTGGGSCGSDGIG